MEVSLPIFANELEEEELLTFSKENVGEVKP